ncbi:DUF6226 family protein [Demequina sp. NBRC 110051]|uniref:DUF6226 family protein n=1 Tax=Demequina sp. NBRC 110051 TaxID=1570340 RepID=UPI0009FFE142|nr:DUF6226 family protein [Demequina sp. NBRC 110051]
MTPAGYTRPAIDAGEYRDDAGTVIPYGRRWEGAPYDGFPPEWAYSICPHPERFAPLTTVTEAIVAFLASTYDVKVATFDVVDPAEPEEALPEAVRRHLRERAAWAKLWVRVTVLTPTRPGAAALAFLFTESEDGFPGGAVFAGESLDHRTAGCGCDACDDSIEALADDLEECVFAVVEGHAFERVRDGALQRGYDVPGWGSSMRTTPGNRRNREVRRRVADAVRARGSEKFRAWVSP